LVKFLNKIKPVRWCLYIIYNRSDRFIFFTCLDQGVEFGCYRFYLYQMFVLVLVYYCFIFVNCKNHIDYILSQTTI